MPNLNKSISITTIHEIDPTQLLPLKKNIIYDSSPHPRENTIHDVYFIAGFHHTHADIAITGLKNNIDVVVEKPLMTTRLELEEIIAALKHSSSEYYACFQRRYHRFNDYVFQDFQLKKSDPISYYAIIYEESLPEFHWYRWPNSRSAIISNGCHWIDHFLFLNHFSPVLTSSAQKTKSGDIIIVVALENNAVLSLTLSHTGSSRI
ncbi:MAG: oxidoreductase, partial [uncultured bacterium]